MKSLCLKFDIYDLELSYISSDSYLKNILLSTSNQSILAIEDIDCSIKLKDRENDEDEEEEDHYDTQLTLSGLLNSIDGLWSSYGDERIIIFTTNHKDRLDPALLRPGRMDVHIHLPYCTIHGFKFLASNYLGIHGDHQLFGEIEGLIHNAKVTPAEVAEELMKSDDADVALGRLVKFLKQKMLENNGTKDEMGSGLEIHDTKGLKSIMINGNVTETMEEDQSGILM